jgi:hypothetical protein
VSPRRNVLQAGGPGYDPFKMCHPCNSHSAKSHGARLLVCVSSLFLGMEMSCMDGDMAPTRVFQSPQTTCIAYCGMHPTISSTWLHATSSSMPRFIKLCAGGKYIFPTQTLSPSCPYIHTLYAYSFPKYRKIFIPFFTSSASPPLFPFSLRYSKT